MTPAHRRYVRTEMAIAAVINAALSAVFVWLAFGGEAVVPVLGWRGLAVDTVPQSLMVALMSCLVPTLLTRRRLAAGRVTALSRGRRWPRHALVRALLVAVPIAALAGLVGAAVLPLTGSSWPLGAVAVLKPLYGALLGAIIARLAVLLALGDAPGRR
ncbi:hypothetical protein GCM10008023_31760 [Sphingomonas glacialis]|uniref:Uncharacterized protein n=1 Tax=Sphingomonas glacialis TaxID=658225 RepID=A0ABQ3LNX2_9SPHN|nr:hypothetical protein [Sphingomonas glacialis]GHH22091.1 hypothetical protein GCM10008023_31760 [Sphingomonas glacialis]